PHAIVVALALQGHVNPTIQLALKLASKGLSITFINFEHIHYQITLSNPTCCDNKNDIFFEARTKLSSLEIEYLTVSDGLPLEFDRLSNPQQSIGATIHCLPAHMEVAVSKIMKSRPSTCCLIADAYSVWAPKLANKFRLLHASFWTEAAMVLDYGFHIDLLKENGHVGPGSSTRKDVIDYIPGIPSIKRKDLISFLHEENLTSMEHQYIVKVMDYTKGADFILGNNIQELEAQSIEAIEAQTPFYAIGPLFPHGFTKSPIATSLWAESDCTHWLDSRPTKSILYISFGSCAQVTKDELEEIAYGIKLSGVNFIWVIRANMVGSDDPDLLPVGFKDEVCDRGGFLTHCGWNSTLESIWCQIPLICFPLVSDQFTNQKLIVDDWKIGCNLCEEKPLKRDEVQQKIKDLIGGQMGDELNATIKGIKRLLDTTITTDGFSEKNANNFIKDLMNASIKKKIG
ncbi:UDP-glycosyltransferase 86A1, partial [Bienertia sinuspersici]